ncbi:hypothetical protein G6F43_007625 [Rhizopus delemar]|nr:hypothetical protein G6F43_007625 [Rhizopus delemar]
MYQQMLYQQQHQPQQYGFSNETAFMDNDNIDLYQNYMIHNNNSHQYSYAIDQIPDKAEKAQKRAEHNAIERARRESLNTKLQQLALSLPNIQNDRRPSKGTIIERTLEYIKQTVQKEEEFKYQIEQLRKANETLYSQMVANDEFGDDDEDELITETPEDTFSYKSSPTSSPTLPNLPLLHQFEKQENIDLLMNQGRSDLLV